ncbi:MAG: photosynthetic reaction center subunit H [Comamonadaceae bacterium]|nr:MAG: photosynthetic reaction center subunit H [Comamonadaceae bacterium]
METGAITQYIDVAQIALYAFWIFFAGLIYHLLQENKREGYPLESERSAHVRVQGWPPMPAPRTYLLRDGSTRTFPNDHRSTQPLAAEPVGGWLGAPLVPTGNPMLDGVGPGAWADRPDVPDTTVDGTPRLVPLRVAQEYTVAAGDPDPRGMEVVGADGEVGGTVVDLWVDRSEALFRYLELSVPGDAGHRRVLLPINFTRIKASGIRVKSILGGQFAQVPGTAQPDVVTLLEEEKVMAYYGGGVLYATPARQEPLL